MNLALSVIFLAILLIPPLIGLFTYKSGTYASAAPKLTFVEYLLLSAILSLFLHGLIIHFFNLPVDYKFLIQFVSGQFKQNEIDNYDGKLEGYFLGFVKYNLFVCSGCWIVGLIARYFATHRQIRSWAWLQRKRNMNRPSKAFSYFNDWWYYFRANEYDSRFGVTTKKPFVHVDVVVDTNDTTILYTGLLKDFIIKDNTLDRIYLTNPLKRLFTIKGENAITDTIIEGKGVVIPSGLLCIPYANISNISIRFLDTNATFSVQDEKVKQRIRTAKPIYPAKEGVEHVDRPAPNS